ncbi:MAG TPA: STAS domain-containing protein [Candidatus Acidoferrum sp.]
MALELAKRESGDVTIVDLRGRCTLGEETELLGRDLKKLIDGGCRKILLNLTELLQIDSTGVSTIVATYVSLRRLKGEVKLLHPTGRVQTVLEITHMLQVIPNFEDEAKAIASFSSRTYTAKS